jgi:hypothetical protein
MRSIEQRPGKGSVRPNRPTQLNQSAKELSECHWQMLANKPPGTRRVANRLWHVCTSANQFANTNMWAMTIAIEGRDKCSNQTCARAIRIGVYGAYIIEQLVGEMIIWKNDRRQRHDELCLHQHPVLLAAGTLHMRDLNMIGNDGRNKPTYPAPHPDCIGKAAHEREQQWCWSGGADRLRTCERGNVHVCSGFAHTHNHTQWYSERNICEHPTSMPAGRTPD